MKLKKIAALALAGVMAVSMLAGCGTDKKPGTGEGEGEGTVVTTGYSAELGKAVELSTDEAKYISFADNATDQTALEAAVKGLSYSTLEDFGNQNWTTAKTVEAFDGSTSYPDMAKMLSSFEDSAKLESITVNALNMGGYAKQAQGDLNTKGLRVGAVFAVNGGVDKAVVLDEVASAVESQIKMLPDENVDGATSHSYSYVVSVSVANKAQSANYNGTNASTTFVAVTITRTVTEG